MSANGTEKDRLITALRAEVAQQQHQNESRIAEIHDGPLQRVIAAHMQIQTMLSNPEILPDQAKQYEELDELLTTGIEQLRSILLDGGAGQETLGDVDDLQGLCNELSSSGFHVALALEGDWLDVPPSRQKPVLMILREGIWNAKKHSGAAGVQVTATMTADSQCFVVEDSGIGFDPAQVSPDRFGLCTMLQRARTHGLELHIDSEHQEGTRIQLTCKKTVPGG